MTADKKRREPDQVPPIVVGGLKLEAPYLGVPLGYAQDGGIVTARDASCGQLLWSQRIYAITYDGEIEDDKQDVFINCLELASNGQSLWIGNERGERFRLSLLNRSVEKIT